MRNDPKPQPRWKQDRDRVVASWRRSRDARRRTAETLRSWVAQLLTLAISMLGAILVAYGVWTIYAPAGYITGGLLLWAVQWNYGGSDS